MYKILLIIKFLADIKLNNIMVFLYKLKKIENKLILKYELV